MDFVKGRWHVGRRSPGLHDTHAIPGLKLKRETPKEKKLLADKGSES